MIFVSATNPSWELEELDLPGPDVEANDEEGRNTWRRLHHEPSIEDDLVEGVKGDKGRGAPYRSGKHGHCNVRVVPEASGTPNSKHLRFQAEAPDLSGVCSNLNILYWTRM